MTILKVLMGTIEMLHNAYMLNTKAAPNWSRFLSSNILYTITYKPPLNF